MYPLTHLQTSVHSSQTNPYPTHNSHEAALAVGEHTERLPADQDGEHCAGLTGVGQTAAENGNRATHFKLWLTLKICGSLEQLLSTHLHRVCVKLRVHIWTHTMTHTSVQTPTHYNSQLKHTTPPAHMVQDHCLQQDVGNHYPPTHTVPHSVTHKKWPHWEGSTQRGCLLPQCV